MQRTNPSKLTATLCATALALGLAGCQTMPGTDGGTSGTDVIAENATASFSVGLIPNKTPPIKLGTPLGFKLSSSMQGYAHLYLINASGTVLALGENMPVKSGKVLRYPRPADKITLRASPPAGMERAILLVTRQPFLGFGDAHGKTVTHPVSLPKRAQDFVRELNRATDTLPASQWSLAETRVRVYDPAS